MEKLWRKILNSRDPQRALDYARNLFKEFINLGTSTQRRAVLDLMLTKTVLTLLDQNKGSEIKVNDWNVLKTEFNQNLTKEITAKIEQMKVQDEETAKFVRENINKVG